jgi:hypothetical protein
MCSAMLDVVNARGRLLGEANAHNRSEGVLSAPALSRMYATAKRETAPTSHLQS